MTANKLYDIFKDKNLDKIPSSIWENNAPICWYPSSRYDFRHIFYWDYLSKVSEAAFPSIFIHTDFTCLDYNPYPKKYMDIVSRIITNQNEKEGKPGPHPLLYTGYILDVFGENYLTITKWTELYLKEDVFFPNKEILYSCTPENRTHRVYAIQCQLINYGRDILSLKKGNYVQTLAGNRVYNKSSGKGNNFVIKKG